MAFTHRPASQSGAEVSRFSRGEFSGVLGFQRPRRARAPLAIARRDVAFPFCPQGRRPVLSISRLHSRPASASVNASAAASPPPPHDSRSAWFATPSLWGSFIPNSPPVYPGAFGQSTSWDQWPPSTRRAAAAGPSADGFTPLNTGWEGRPGFIHGSITRDLLGVASNSYLVKSPTAWDAMPANELTTRSARHVTLDIQSLRNATSAPAPAARLAGTYVARPQTPRTIALTAP